MLLRVGVGRVGRGRVGVHRVLLGAASQTGRRSGGGRGQAQRAGEGDGWSGRVTRYDRYDGVEVIDPGRDVRSLGSEVRSVRYSVWLRLDAKKCRENHEQLCDYELIFTPYLAGLAVIMTRSCELFRGPR